MENAHPVQASPTSRPQARIKERAIIIIACVLLLIGGAAVRLATWERFLPFIDYRDEVVYVALAEHFRGVSDQTPLINQYGTLAPAYVALNMGLQEGHDAMKTVSWDMPAQDYPVLRLFSVLMGVLTIAVLIWGGMLIAGSWAGFFAGAVWAFSPLVVEINSLAIPDPPLYLVSALALVTGLAAWKYDSPRYLFISLLMGILAIYLKLWVAMTLIPFLLVAAALFFKNPRRMLPWMVFFFVIAASTGAYMIFGLNPLQSTVKMSEYGGGDLLTRTFDPARLANNWRHLTALFSDVLFWAAIIGGVVAFIYNYRQKRQVIAPKFIALLLVYMLLGFLLVTAISNITVVSGRMRHLLPTALGFMLFWGGCIWQILIALRGDRKVQSASGLLQAGVILFFVGGLAIHHLPGNLSLIERYQQTHVVNILRDWFDISVPRDGIAMQPYQSDLDRIWNRWWGAYAGNRPFEYWSEDQEDVLATTPQEYVDRNITYFVIGESDLAWGRYDDPAMRDWVEQLTLVKTFDPEKLNLAGDTSYVYRMLPPQYEADFNYGDTISLVGYDLSGTEPTAGETLTLRPYWRIMQQPGINYTMFVHVYPEDNFDIQAQADSQPVADSYPTTLWQDTDELFVGRDVQITLPETIETGAYRLVIGLYDVNTLTRLISPEGDEFYEIRIEVQ